MYHWWHFSNHCSPSLINSPVLIFSTVSHVLWDELISEKDQALPGDMLQMDNWDKDQATPTKYFFTLKNRSETESCIPALIFERSDTESTLAADAYLTFIAVIHQAYIQQRFFTLILTHAHTPVAIITSPNMGSITVFPTHYRHLPDIVPKKAK